MTSAFSVVEAKLKHKQQPKQISVAHLFSAYFDTIPW